MPERDRWAVVGAVVGGGAAGVGLAYVLNRWVLPRPTAPRTAPPSSTTASQPVRYVVQLGDTLGALALCTQSTVDELMQLNPAITNPNLIYAGQVLTLPRPLTPGCHVRPQCSPVTMACLLDYAVGAMPVPNPAAWVPAQQAARTVVASGYDLYTLTHHPVGYFGESVIPAQRAADYLLSVGVDPCPLDIYDALQTASTITGVPLPLLLSVAYTESRFLQYGQQANAAVVAPRTGATGLMQMTAGATKQVQQSFPAAAAQYGITWATVQTNLQTNAIAAAFYLRYLAGRVGLAYTSTDYAAWLPALEQYGEGNVPGVGVVAQVETIPHAQDPTWVAQQTPAHAMAVQYAHRLGPRPFRIWVLPPPQLRLGYLQDRVAVCHWVTTAPASGRWVRDGPGVGQQLQAEGFILAPCSANP